MGMIHSDALIQVLGVSQCRTFLGYQLLIQYVSGMEKSLDIMDVQETNTYFREVSYDQCLWIIIFTFDRA